MTTETASPLTPGEVLAAARDFFLGAERMADAWIDTESSTHVAFCTFRGNLSIAAFPDPDGGGEGATRIRVTTLREEGIVPRLLAHIALAGGRG